jgi:hypothetical protein
MARRKRRTTQTSRSHSRVAKRRLALGDTVESREMLGEIVKVR